MIQGAFVCISEK